MAWSAGSWGEWSAAWWGCGGRGGGRLAGAGGAVEGEGRRRRVGGGPGALHAEVHRTAGRQARVVALVDRRDGRAALGDLGVPGRRHVLVAAVRPSDGPTPERIAEVGHVDAGGEAAGPLVGGVGGLAAGGGAARGQGGQCRDRPGGHQRGRDQRPQPPVPDGASQEGAHGCSSVRGGKCGSAPTYRSGPVPCQCAHRPHLPRPARAVAVRPRAACEPSSAPAARAADGPTCPREGRAVAVSAPRRRGRGGPGPRPRCRGSTCRTAPGRPAGTAAAACRRRRAPGGGSTRSAPRPV